MTEEMFNKLVDQKVAYLTSRRRHGVITQNNKHHAFKKGTVVKLLFCRSMFIGNSRKAKKSIVWEVQGANRVSGKQTRQTILHSDIK